MAEKACHVFGSAAQVGLTQALGRMKPLLQLLVMFLAVGGVSACGATCGNEVVAVVTSPSGSTKAVVFNRNCGATTGPNTQLSVLPSHGQLPNVPGNALILGGVVPLKVRWVSETALSVSGLGASDMFKQESSVAGVSVAYGT